MLQGGNSYHVIVVAKKSPRVGPLEPGIAPRKDKQENPENSSKNEAADKAEQDQGKSVYVKP